MIVSSLLSLTPISTSPQPEPARAEPPSQRETVTPRADAVPVANPSGGEHSEWGYTGPSGPDHWAELSADYAICARGQQESPVDLSGALAARLGRLTIDWQPVPLRVVNNGHTIQVDAPPGSAMNIGGKSYALAQMHIHHPSEHLLNGRRFPLELHFVHRGPDGVFGVVGVFVEQGEANPTLQTILNAMPTVRGATRIVEGRRVDFNALRPRGSAFHRYEGSLTTPPCSETVDWVILDEPINASADQINAFERVYPANARPIQALNRRFLLRSR